MKGNGVNLSQIELYHLLIPPSAMPVIASSNAGMT